MAYFSVGITSFYLLTEYLRIFFNRYKLNEQVFSFNYSTTSKLIVLFGKNKRSAISKLHIEQKNGIPGHTVPLQLFYLLILDLFLLATFLWFIKGLKFELRQKLLLQKATITNCCENKLTCV